MAGQQSPAHSTGWDFTASIRALCADLVARLPELGHIDLDRVGIGFSQARKRVPHGVWAKLTPLRFEAGSRTMVRRGRTWTIEPVRDRSGRELLYLLSFYLPRFLDLPMDEKLTTVVHELWHISPNFDGDLRRHHGRCFAHGSSQRRYDDQMRRLSERWLALQPPPSVYEFLRLSFAQLWARHTAIYGTRYAIPRLVRADAVA
jgi:predicted metallopeptidase